MSNMSYCRFRNTLGDLQDCAEHVESSPQDLGLDEHLARLRLIEACANILEAVGYDVERPKTLEIRSNDEDINDVR